MLSMNSSNGGTAFLGFNKRTGSRIIKIVLKMKMARKHRAAAFTRVELAVVTVVFIVAGLILFPALRRANWTSSRICCNCNLKQIGVAYRVWANDHWGQYPAFEPQTNGGWSNFLSRP